MVCAAVGAQRVEPARFALPALARNPFLWWWAERLDEVRGWVGEQRLRLGVQLRRPPLGSGRGRGFARRVTRGRPRRRGWRGVAGRRGGLLRGVAWAQGVARGRLAGEWLVVWEVDGELERRVEGLADARLSLAVLGDPLRVADDAVLVGAVEAEVLAREVDAVAVDRAGVADVGLLFGL